MGHDTDKELDKVARKLTKLLEWAGVASSWVTKDPATGKGRLVFANDETLRFKLRAVADGLMHIEVLVRHPVTEDYETQGTADASDLPDTVLSALLSKAQVYAALQRDAVRQARDLAQELQRKGPDKEVR